MWMQILQAAGLPLIGRAYPSYWEEVLGDFNTRGFHESRLRAGIWWKTNPDPESGAYLFPDQTQRHLVKVFIEGLTRTDIAFVDRVVGTMRDWRSFTRSFASLEQTERDYYSQREVPFPVPARDLPIPYQWWLLNYELVRDIATRRYPVRLTTYDRVLRDPPHEIGRMLDWIEVDDPQARRAAIACVEGTLRTPREALAVEDEVEPDVVEIFDALFDTVDRGEIISPALIGRMNLVQQMLQERFHKDHEE